MSYGENTKRSGAVGMNFLRKILEFYNINKVMRIGVRVTTVGLSDVTLIKESLSPPGLLFIYEENE